MVADIIQHANSHANSLETTSKTLTGLSFLDFCESSPLKIGVTSVTFNLSGKSEFKIVLLNNFVEDSGQVSILAFKTFGVIFLNVLAFFVLGLLNSFSMSDTEASVKTNSSGTVVLFLINMLLGWFLYLKIAFFTWSSVSFD